MWIILLLAPVVETGWETVLGRRGMLRFRLFLVDRMIDVSDDSLYTKPGLVRIFAGKADGLVSG